MRSKLCREELYSLYVEQNKSLSDVGEVFRRTPQAILYWMRKLGIPTRSTGDGTRLTREKRSIAATGKKRGPHRQETKELLSRKALLRADKTARGTTISPNGYLVITRGPNHGRHVHDVLMEERLGRRLTDNEVVHHRDENGLNNDMENLQLMTRNAHASLHVRESCKNRRRKNGRFC